MDHKHECKSYNKTSRSIGRNLYELGWQRHDLLKKKKRLTGLDQNLKHVLQKNTIRKTKSLRKDI